MLKGKLGRNCGFAFVAVIKMLLIVCGIEGTFWCVHIFLAACRRELTYSARRDYRTATHRSIAQKSNKDMLSTAV